MSTFSWKELCILVAEDDESLREVMIELLKTKECKVLSAENGLEALNIIYAQHVDIVISDVRMPIMDGIELLERIREKHSEVPAVFLATGFSDISLDYAKKLGARGLFQKPFNMQTFLDSIETLMTKDV